jgi:2-keto-3-deoxy-L-rhamnonate aldolase RhmA
VKDMPNGLEIMKAAVDDFKKIQRYMTLAKEENAAKTYAELKREYLAIKTILQTAGVNLTDIDEIKE